MGISDVTAEAVERALAEFDDLGRKVFLHRYGFGRARHYFLVHDGRDYDSKAVVGVAHRYSGSDPRPLRPQEFSGGSATVVRHLESLGFKVANYSGGTKWAVEERILVLDLYLRSGLLGKSDPEVVELCRFLATLTFRSGRPDRHRGRSPDSVELKLKNFAWLDHEGGLEHVTRDDTAVWKRFASDEDALAAAVAAIREGRELPAAQPSAPAVPRFVRVKVEEQHVEQFWSSTPSRDIEVTPRERSLVLAYRDYLESQGHTVTRGRYRPDGSDSVIASDLVDETEGVLYEAKGHVRRASVRMAIGQLLDYRRFESSSMRLAVLLPYRPSEDLMDLILKVPASVVWRTKNGFKRNDP